MKIKLESYFRIFIYGITFLLLITYFLGKLLSCRYLLSFTNFDNSSGILSLIVISLVLAHIPTIKSIIREIAFNRVAHLADDEVVELFRERIEINDDFFKLVKKKIDGLEAGSDTAQKIGNEVSTGSTISKDN